MITYEDYIILKNLNENIKKWYVARNKDGQLYCFSVEPKKHRKIGIWSSQDRKIVHMYIAFLFNKNILKIIRWKDKEVKRFIDYIKEYERYNEV